jgi:hypothetical protein
VDSLAGRSGIGEAPTGRIARQRQPIEHRNVRRALVQDRQIGTGLGGASAHATARESGNYRNRDHPEAAADQAPKKGQDHGHDSNQMPWSWTLNALVKVPNGGARLRIASHRLARLTGAP